MTTALVATAVAIAAFTGLEALLPDVHHVPGSLAAYGFAGCAAIVLVAKALGAGLKRPESAGD
jgi:hypothetical protein